MVPLYEACHAPASLTPTDRDALAVTYVCAQGNVVLPVSRYGDLLWDYTPFFPHAARAKSDKQIRWEKTPYQWVESLKAVAAAFTFKKRPGGIRLDPATVPKRMIPLNAFAKWASSNGIQTFSAVTAFDMARYLKKLRDDGVVDRTLSMHIALFRRVYEMRSYLVDSFSTEAFRELGFDQVGPLWEPGAQEARRTELIPLQTAAELFSAALSALKNADTLLQLRDELNTNWSELKGGVSRNHWGDTVKKPRVQAAGFRSAHEFESALTDIRTAAYIVLAQTTGCRVHELGDARLNCVYKEVVDGVSYWWLKSATHKIGDGPARWLAPAIAERAAQVLKWHSEPMRRKVRERLATARKRYARAKNGKERSTLATEVLELERNLERLFLSETSNGVVSTDTSAHNKQLNAFARRYGIRLASPLTTHRFRRTYAVIVVHLNKGARIDLVTLQYHFKHATVLMSEWYASLSDTDKELYDLIDEESEFFDLALVDHWLQPSTPLSGGLGTRIKAYPGRDHQPIFFRTKREFVESIREGLNIRSTGHSWCLADGLDCGGQGLFEAARCGDCGNGVIDDEFTAVWQGLQMQHGELTQMEDIGPGGRAKAREALAAADRVLADLLHAASEE